MGYAFDENSAKRISRAINEVEKSVKNSTKPKRRYKIGGVGSSKVKLAQAPSGGIPARTNQTPGSATCDAVVVADADGAGYFAGDLVKTGDQYTIKNWTFDVAGALGDRIIQVEGHFHGAFVVGWSCTNNATAGDIETQ